MSLELHSMCEDCGGKCCQYFCFQIDAPDDFKEFDDIRWYLLHENITVHVDEGEWYISIANRCKALDEKGLCKIYEDRPMICRGYTMDNCDHTGGDYQYEEFFETPEDIRKYARKFLGKKAYKQAEAKARAKAALKEAKRQKKERKLAEAAALEAKGVEKRCDKSLA